MKVLRGFTDVRLDGPGSVVSIGNFDGVHRGHQAVIGSAVAAAAERGRGSVVCTFDPHTRVFLHPEAPPRLLETLDQRLEAIAALGVETAVVIPFDRTVATTPRDRFVAEFLRGALNAVELHVSAAFKFGAGARGNVDYLRGAAPDHDFELEVVPFVMVGGKPISSTRIRDALVAGRVDEAAALLGRPFTLIGEVVGGAGRGRDLDAPTANLAVDNTFVPGRGVYVTEARLPDGVYGAVTNIGVRPTFEEDGELTIEAHLLDREGSLYGARMELGFLKKLRDEMRFEDAEALAAQIAEDVRNARHYLGNEGRGVRYTAGVSSQVPAGEPPRRKR